MSNTRYGRANLLRLDDEELAIVERLVMKEIEKVSHANAASGGGTEPDKRHLRRLRSLLDQLGK